MSISYTLFKTRIYCDLSKITRGFPKPKNSELHHFYLSTAVDKRILKLTDENFIEIQDYGDDDEYRFSRKL